MSHGLFIAAAGASARLQSLDVVSDNLANASTDGFKETRISFNNVLDEAGATATAHRQGLARPTGRGLDVALNGPGFFTVADPQSPSGKLYTRLGRFHVSNNGELVTSDGRTVMGTNGPITGIDGIPRIEGGGAVFSGDKRVGTLAVAEFENPDVLSRRGALLFAAPEGTDPKTVKASMLPGSIESSTVNAIGAVGRLIRVQRSFETMTKAIETYRHMDRTLKADVGDR